MCDGLAKVSSFLSHLRLNSEPVGAGPDADSGNHKCGSRCFQLLELPGELQDAVLSFVEGSSELRAAGCASSCLREAALRQWRGLFERDFGAVKEVLVAHPPKWWGSDERPAGMWRERYCLLVQGASFQAQVLSRELENPAEDFTLSAYDASVTFTGFQACNDGSGGAREPLFTATYLPMGAERVIETTISASRLRPPPCHTSAHRPHAWCVANFGVGQQVEVQWRLELGHPFGWWLGTVQSLLWDRAVITFPQYPATSPWRHVEVPLVDGCKDGAVSERELGYSLLGGLRALNAVEVEQWRHQKLLLRMMPGAGSEPEERQEAVIEVME